jgi:hypothetical protein
LEDDETHRQMCETAFSQNDRRLRLRVRPLDAASWLCCVRDDELEGAYFSSHPSPVKASQIPAAGTLPFQPETL